MFRAMITPIFRALDCVLQLVVKCIHDVAGRWPAGNIVGALYHKL